MLRLVVPAVVLGSLLLQFVWMSLALGAVLKKLGAPAAHAWIPVKRWVAVARAGRASTLTVAISRSIALLGALFAIGGYTALVLTTPTDAENTLTIVALAGTLLWLVGSLTAWVLWIYGAGTIQMRMRAPRGLSWVAALWPVVWASIMGWGKYRAIGGGAATTGAADHSNAPGASPGGAFADTGVPAHGPASGDPAASDAAPATATKVPQASPFALTSEPQEPEEPAGPPPPLPPSPAAAAASSGGFLSSLPPGWSQQPQSSAIPPSPTTPPPTTPPLPTTPPPHAVSSPPPPAADAAPASVPYEGQLSPYLAPPPQQPAPTGQPLPPSPPAPSPSPSPHPAPSAPPYQAAPQFREPTPAPPAAPTEIAPPPGRVATPVEAAPVEQAAATPLMASQPTPPHAPPHAPPPSPPSSPAWAAPIPTPAPSELADNSGAASASAVLTGDNGDDDHTIVARPRRDTWALEVDGQTYEIGDGTLVIGRATAKPTPGTLGITDATRTMSKRHAELTFTDGVWWVQDLDSTNGTYVKSADGTEERVEGSDRKPVQAELMLGDLAARIVKRGDDE